MQFLSDVYLRCPDCDGKRYRPEILEVTLQRPVGGRGRIPISRTLLIDWLRPSMGNGR
jgi:hypothetical protein